MEDGQGSILPGVRLKMKEKRGEFLMKSAKGKRFKNSRKRVETLDEEGIRAPVKKVFPSKQSTKSGYSLFSKALPSPFRDPKSPSGPQRPHTTLALAF